MEKKASDKRNDDWYIYIRKDLRQEVSPFAYVYLNSPPPPPRWHTFVRAFVVLETCLYLTMFLGFVGFTLLIQVNYTLNLAYLCLSVTL